MMFIQIFIATLISSGLAWDPYTSTSNVHPSLAGSLIRSIGDFKHHEANVVDEFINRKKHRNIGKNTAVGNLIRGLGNFKYQVADAVDDVVNSVKTDVGKGDPFFNDIRDEFFQKKHPAGGHDSFQLSSLSPPFSPSLESGVYPALPEFLSGSVDGSVSATLDLDNTLYPYPEIKKPVSPRFVFIHDKGQRDLTIDDIIDAGNYLKGVKKIAASNKVNS